MIPTLYWWRESWGECVENESSEILARAIFPRTEIALEYVYSIPQQEIYQGPAKV